MSTIHNTLKALQLSDLEQAIAIQSHAFFNDPLWVYLIPDTQKRAVRLPQFFRPLYRLGILNNQAYGVGDPLEGVAIWGVPNQKTSVNAVIGAGFQNILLSPFFVQFFRASRIFRAFETMKRRYATQPHYYLETIAVAPEAQGKGVASQLIKPFLAQADVERIPVYTETITPENVSLYEHYGFQVMEEYAVPNTGLRLWSFYRTPQQS